MAEEKERPRPPRVPEPDQNPGQKPITEGANQSKKPRVVKVGDDDTNN